MKLVSLTFFFPGPSHIFSIAPFYEQILTSERLLLQELIGTRLFHGCTDWTEWVNSSNLMVTNSHLPYSVTNITLFLWEDVIPFQILKQFKSPYTEDILPFQPLFFFPLWREVESPKKCNQGGCFWPKRKWICWVSDEIQQSVSLNLLY